MTIQQVDSTNNYLKQLVSNSKPLIEGTVIMAVDQYAGRGQHQNGWFAEPGKNLTFSILLKPSFLPVSQQFDLVRAISLGVFDALHPLLGDGLTIKWPNDIYYGNRKLGGMLIENMIQGLQIKNSIAGIGININQEGFPENLPGAISVKQILQQDYDLKYLLSEICRHVEAYYLSLKADKISLVRNKYLSRLYRLNEEGEFKSKEGRFSGMIHRVTDSGLLVVKNNKGEDLEFSLKEIEFLH
ncbi:biotin--[acetyl-CoA-carboxylase] ligase [Mucilaginibacter sp. L3T2-6]|uniref:biotin--[acetyl-CoA-carboxylase] ligase n=1 Tax=Mucilaginibacter sp. L3T2-6 TaxID=3062491 RepID=UPI0026756781|nr:biotin--[acetyl-CoA-carboxylase] ligase [Mucilaginibacter sp. L3T2-6]MDO3643767.1 biotin--[acetyl-CoA-carboxylase] ligase [Mucilaginibacter sp. L3T2-6]MDV6216218.1 biotin--[acetyl-CoA-carboxylase] ligase [Mucilaginibacter sp. L3T2-6]